MFPIYTDGTFVSTIQVQQASVEVSALWLFPPCEISGTLKEYFILIHSKKVGVPVTRGWVLLLF